MSRLASSYGARLLLRALCLLAILFFFSSPHYTDTKSRKGQVADLQVSPELASYVNHWRVYDAELEAAKAAMTAEPSVKNLVAFGKLALIGTTLETEAEAAFQQALQLDTECAEAYTGLGWLHLDLWGWSRAVRGLHTSYSTQANRAMPYFQKAVQLNPEYAEAYLGLGYVYLDLHKPEEAAKFLLEAIKLQPDNAEAWDGLSNCYEKQSQFEKAIAARLEKIRCEALQPADRYHFDNLYHTNEGMRDWMRLAGLYTKLGEHERSIEIYQQLLENNPGEPWVLHHLGIAYFDSGKPSAALAVYERLSASCQRNLEEEVMCAIYVSDLRKRMQQ